MLSNVERFNEFGNINVNLIIGQNHFFSFYY